METKKYLRTALALLLVLVLGVSAGSISVSASSADDPEEWDSETEMNYVYDTGNIILAETDVVRISAGLLMYIKTDYGMMLYLVANAENFTDEEITIELYNNENQTRVVSTAVPGNEMKSIIGSNPVMDWNCLIGETEDCCQGSCTMEITSGSGAVSSVQYDWYASRKAPFANIIIEGGQEVGERLESFTFPTSDDMVAFIQEYGQTGPTVWHEPNWELKDGDLTIQGTVTPDRENFIDFSATVSAYTGEDTSKEEYLQEQLLAFYQEISEKTGLEFEGAEDTVKEIFSLENTWYTPVKYVCDGYELSMISNDYNKGFSLSREYGEYEELPYKPADVLEYLGAGSEKGVACKREVEFGDLPSMADDSPYRIRVELDEKERLGFAEAEYHGDYTEDTRSYFESFASLLLTGEANEKLMEFIDDCYNDFDSEDQRGWSHNIGRDYAVSLVLGPSYSDLEITIKGGFPEDAPAFPNEEEQEALLLDPITRLGIDKDIEVPETVLFTKDDINVVLEKALYTEDHLYIIFRMENVPDDAGIEVALDELNGSAVNEWPYDQQSLTSANLFYGDTHEVVEKEYVWLRTADLPENIPDFAGISSITLHVNYTEKGDEDDYYGTNENNIYGEPMTIETGH